MPRASGFVFARRGISVVVVLGLIALTMAMSYALARVEFYTANVQQNNNRQDLSRQAAMVGLSVALRTMEQSTWAGTGTTLTGNLNSTDSYSVTYTAGDASLTSTSSSYWEYPYRVTLVSTGKSVDPNNSNSQRHAQSASRCPADSAKIGKRTVGPGHDRKLHLVSVKV